MVDTVIYIRCQGVVRLVACPDAGFHIHHVHVCQTEQIGVVCRVLLVTHTTVGVCRLADDVFLHVCQYLVAGFHFVPIVVAHHKLVGVAAVGFVYVGVVIVQGHIYPFAAQVGRCRGALFGSRIVQGVVVRLVGIVGALQGQRGTFASAPGYVAHVCVTAPVGVARVAVGVTRHHILDGEQGFVAVVGAYVE